MKPQNTDDQSETAIVTFATAMVSALNYPAALLDADGAIIAQNDGMTRYIGVGSSLIDHLDPASFASDLAARIRARQSRIDQVPDRDPDDSFVRNDVTFQGGNAPLTVTQIALRNGSIGYLCQKPPRNNSNDARLRFFLNHLAQGVWDFDARNDQMVVSSHWRDMRGLGPDDVVLGKHWLDEIHPDDKVRLEQAFDGQRKGREKTIDVQYRHKHRSGGWIWIWCRGHVMEADADGLPVRIVGTDTDITEMKKAEAEVAQLAEKIQLAVQASGMGIWEFDPIKKRVHWDDRMLEIYGLTDGQNDRSGEAWETFVHPDDLAQTAAYSDQQLRLGRDFCRDYRIVRPDGDVRTIRSIARNAAALKSEGKLIGVNLDVTEDYRRAEELEKARQKLEHDSRHDALTGLANRRFLDEETNALFENVTAKDRYAVLHMDLDHFKQINDTLGHDAGDAVLKHVAAGLRHDIGDLGLICRVGGDEFVALLRDPPDTDALVATAERIVDRFRLPFLYQGHTCIFGSSIGIAVGQGTPDSPSEIFVNADQALYAAKNAGRSCVRVFSDETRSAVHERLQMHQALLDALTNGQLQPFYQPQFDARTGVLVGAEALIRCVCPDRGVMLPADFLPLAAENGLISQIDDCVLRQVLADQDTWQSVGQSFPRISVNVSPERLIDDTYTSMLKKLIRGHHKLTCELIETHFLDSIDGAIADTLDVIRGLGIRLELDDFGTGHASILAMQIVRPSQVKIDQRLVLPAVDNPTQIAVLQSIVHIARLQGVGVTLEGVETDAHIAALRSVDCDVYQGFALGRPMPRSEFTKLLQSRDQHIAKSA